MHARTTASLAVLAGAALAASAQQRIHTVENQDFTYDLSTAPSLAVNEDVVVVAGTHELLMFDKGNPVTSLLPMPVTYAPTLPNPAFPFVPVRDPGPFLWPSLVFPRADYDPYTGRTWIAYQEREGVFSGSGGPEFGNSCDPHLHLAIQKDLTTNPQTNFSTAQWWYYTGTTITAPQGAARTALNLGASDAVTGVQPLRVRPPIEPQHSPPVSLRMPSIAFDETHIAVAVTTPVQCGGDGPNSFGAADQTIVIIPRNHPGGSTVDGDRPAEADMVVARLKVQPLVPDPSFNNLAVQEPYEQHDNIMLFISTTGANDPAISQLSIRLKALFWDAAEGEWELRQQLGMGGGSLFLDDVDVPAGFEYRLDLQAFDQDNANTPDFDPGFVFDPNVDGDFFTSAVLAKDNAGNDRVFAVQGVKGAGSIGQPDDFWRVHGT